MRRREFIQCMFPVAGFPIIYPMWSVANTLNGPIGLRKFLDFPDDGRVLVLVQCAGGNDGLNTIVPYNQDTYYEYRPQLAVKKSEVIDINGEIGFHPSLANLRPMYDNGKLAIVQGVGYPNPNRSHFKSTDIWLTASDSNDLKDTGWLGRYFDLVCPPDQEGNTTCGSYGPPAIQIGLTSSLALLGRNPKGISLNDPLAFYNLVTRQGEHGGDPTPEIRTTAQKELEFLRETSASAFAYAGEILAAFEQANNSVTYPDESLAAQLAIVAKLIAGGLSTRVYIVSIKGFDTHANQLRMHSTLLQFVANAISTFQKDLENLGIADRVAGMCFSEFGRRPRENSSAGTDHGTAAPMFIFGNSVQGGVFGSHPNLDNLVNGDLQHNYDFRQIYSTLLETWLRTDANAVLGASFEILPIISGTTRASDRTSPPHEYYLKQNYPNPFNLTTTIEYGLQNTSDIELVIFNSFGRKVATLDRGRKNAGIYKVIWNATNHASGTYFVRMRAERFELTKQMQLVK